ncbi:DeoR/GlpR family DNA-binding transcription regulator [Tistrella bauzanensis]|uniref:DeoR/GlpR family DNA-binding transcription regulator n=1 Tax=Tistrella arctica TaxID=3133430 RepID=A0ABU9YDR1_9PROT
MNATRRRSEILAMIRDAGYVGIDALAARFDVTPQTIRRDVNVLSDDGRLRRMHGGAAWPDRNIAYGTRQVLNLAAKQSIARATAALIPDGASLSLGIGTTPEQVARVLAERGAAFTVITNNVAIANLLSDAGQIDITIAGGRLSDRGVVGEAAERVFSAYRVDFGIAGVGGIDPDGTLLDFTPDEVRARLAISRHCRHRLLIADASKFGRTASASGGRIDDTDTLITDLPPPEPIAAHLDRAGTRVIVAGEQDRVWQQETGR